MSYFDATMTAMWAWFGWSILAPMLLIIAGGLAFFLIAVLADAVAALRRWWQ